MTGPSEAIPTVEMTGPGGRRVVNDTPQDIAKARAEGCEFTDEDREKQYAEQEKAPKRGKHGAPQDKTSKANDKANAEIRERTGRPDKPEDATSVSKIREGVQPSVDDRLEAQKKTVAIREGRGAQTAAGSGLSASDARENAERQKSEEEHADGAGGSSGSGE